jgi:hypothetical protein
MHAIDEVLKAPTSSADKFRSPSRCLSCEGRILDLHPSPSGLARGRRPQDHRAATPPERATPGCLQEPQGKQRVSKKSWQSLLGELRFASIGIPGSRGLFCILQLASRNPTRAACVSRRQSSPLESFERLVRDLTERPTRLGEIIPDHPRAAGALLAASAWASTSPKTTPLPSGANRSRTGSSQRSRSKTPGSREQQRPRASWRDWAAGRHEPRPGLEKVTVANLTDNTPTLSCNTAGPPPPSGGLCQIKPNTSATFATATRWRSSQELQRHG